MKLNSLFSYKWKTVFLLLVSAFMLGLIPSVPEEGMYPLSEIHKVDLVKAGLKIDPLEIYNPDGVSLIDALVKLGGCTGSFVSEDGLIITNHHCAFGAVSRASTTEHNYLENGFLAEDKSKEIPARGFTCRITESYEDVSNVILDAVKDVDDVIERSNIIRQKMREVGRAASNEEQSIEANVSEMFIGQTYILFKYRIIRDVRLVYVPPRSIGEFGGESDNWVWPRHTGDFSFMRAYVAPDGSAAEYSEDNVPYKPKKYLKVNPNGVSEGDFAFILGYPGRTFRHMPSQFLQYQEDYQLPYIADIFGWMIDKMEEMSEGDEALQLQYAPTIKGLANTMKNYQGKMLGMRRIQLVEKKRAEEEELQKYIESSSELRDKYGSLLNDIDAAYNKNFDIAEANLWFNIYNRFSVIGMLSNFVVEYTDQMQLPNDERLNNYKDERIASTRGRLNYYLSIYSEDYERDFLIKMFMDASQFSTTSRIEALDYLIGENDPYDAIVDFIDNNMMTTGLTEPAYFDSLLQMTPAQIMELNDPLLNFSRELLDQQYLFYDEAESINSALDKLLAELIEVKMQWKKTNFIPDANGTLRLTYGYIKGYSPADAVYYSPITTLSGVIDKSYRGSEYEIPDVLYELYKNKDFGRFYDAKLDGVPVAILYNMDTTGGSSGSPVLNAYGELIGVNFDRAYEATINDYAWNESYSRSIGVDIRYVLWITQKVGGADYLLEEMGVDL